MTNPTLRVPITKKVDLKKNEIYAKKKKKFLKGNGRHPQMAKEVLGEKS